jgi:hypothetical protein
MINDTVAVEQLFQVKKEDSWIADPKVRPNVIEFETYWPDEKTLLWDLD